jgi:trimethylamine--corrinoid protein Co-methyltransferase
MTMATLSWTISGGLSETQLESLHNAALRTIEEVGVRVTHPALLRAAAHAPHSQVDGSHVKLPGALVDEHVRDYRARRAAASHAAPAGYSIDVLTGFAFEYLDPQTGTFAAMDTARCIETAKLVDALHPKGVRGGTPGLPTDVAPQLREILAYKIGCQYSRTAMHVGVSSAASAKYVCEMGRVVGMPFHFPVFCLSPLRVEGETIELALELLEQGHELHINVQTMPLQGVSTPINLPAGFVECIATVLAAYTLLRLAGVQQDFPIGFEVYPFDLKLGTIAYGTPEHLLMSLLAVQINRFYGNHRLSCKAFHTNALFPDAHSCSERAAFAAIAALNGARNFQFGGMLGIDKIFSPEQLLYDIETVEYVRHVVDGCELPAEDEIVALLRDIGPAGEFLTHDSTLAHCRELWTSDLFANTSPEQWHASDGTTVHERALEMLALLRGAEPFELAPDANAELERIYARAVEELT